MNFARALSSSDLARHGIGDLARCWVAGLLAAPRMTTGAMGPIWLSVRLHFFQRVAVQEHAGGKLVNGVDTGLEPGGKENECCAELDCAADGGCPAGGTSGASKPRCGWDRTPRRQLPRCRAQRGDDLGDRLRPLFLVRAKSIQSITDSSSVL